MMKVKLEKIAHARSGDKGDASNVGLIAQTAALYPVLRDEVTAERVKEHFREVCRGPVQRYELPEPPGSQLHPARLPGRRRHREPEERRPGQDPRARVAPDGDRGAEGLMEAGA